MSAACKGWSMAVDTDPMGRVFIGAGPARVYCGHTEDSRDKAMSDAKLIAAAPELLEALEETLKIQQKHYGYASQLHVHMINHAEKIKAAIAKAKS